MQSKVVNCLLDVSDLLPIVGEITRASEAVYYYIEGNNEETKEALIACGMDAALDVVTFATFGEGELQKLALKAAGKAAAKTGAVELFKFGFKKFIGADLRKAFKESIMHISCDAFRASCDALKATMTVAEIEKFTMTFFKERIHGGIKVILLNKFALLMNQGIPEHDDTPDHAMMLVHAATGLPLKKVWQAQQEDPQFFTKLLWVAKHAPAHFLEESDKPEREPEKTKEEVSCEWMFGDAGTFKTLAHWNPFHWSGARPISQGIQELEEQKKIEDHPVNVKVPSDSGDMKQFPNIGEALDYFHSNKFEHS